MVLTQKWARSWCVCARARVAYVRAHACVYVCHHAMMVTVEEELEGAALRSILMPLSLCGLVPFSQLPLAPSMRWLVCDFGSVKLVTHTRGTATLPLGADGKVEGHARGNIKIKEPTLDTFKYKTCPKECPRLCSSALNT